MVRNDLPWFARQRWRAWIETDTIQSVSRIPAGSPVSDGGRGLKRLFAPVPTLLRPGSPVSDGGRGLKPVVALMVARGAARFARQRWRAWIETFKLANNPKAYEWFARQRWRAWIETSLPMATRKPKLRFARQRWRAWIETSKNWGKTSSCGGSPVSDGGRGLKQTVTTSAPAGCRGSPVSDGGRGLKQRIAGH